MPDPHKGLLRLILVIKQAYMISLTSDTESQNEDMKPDFDL